MYVYTMETKIYSDNLSFICIIVDIDHGTTDNHKYLM